MSNIQIKVVLLKPDDFGVEVTLPNGYHDICPFHGNQDEAMSYAMGVQKGLLLAMNAIGFVPSPQPYKPH